MQRMEKEAKEVKEEEEKKSASNNCRENFDFDGMVSVSYNTPHVTDASKEACSRFDCF